eukprot:scaffold4052_cov64-Attheya_sp.AAC.4
MEAISSDHRGVTTGHQIICEASSSDSPQRGHLECVQNFHHCINFPLAKIPVICLVFHKWSLIPRSLAALEHASQLMDLI